MRIDVNSEAARADKERPSPALLGACTDVCRCSAINTNRVRRRASGLVIRCVPSSGMCFKRSTLTRVLQGSSTQVERAERSASSWQGSHERSARERVVPNAKRERKQRRESSVSMSVTRGVAGARYLTSNPGRAAFREEDLMLSGWSCPRGRLHLDGGQNDTPARCVRRFPRR